MTVFSRSLVAVACPELFIGCVTGQARRTSPGWDPMVELFQKGAKSSVPVNMVTSSERQGWFHLPVHHSSTLQ
jgi:hypothetical protein